MPGAVTVEIYIYFLRINPLLVTPLGTLSCPCAVTLLLSLMISLYLSGVTRSSKPFLVRVFRVFLPAALALVDRGVEATELPDAVKAGVAAGVEEGVSSPLDLEVMPGVWDWADSVLRLRFVGAVTVFFFG